jgi:hypothetical protein
MILISVSFYALFISRLVDSLIRIVALAPEAHHVVFLSFFTASGAEIWGCEKDRLARTRTAMYLSSWNVDGVPECYDEISRDFCSDILHYLLPS